MCVCVLVKYVTCVRENECVHERERERESVCVSASEREYKNE